MSRQSVFFSNMLKTARDLGYFRLPGCLSADSSLVLILCLSIVSFTDLKPFSEYYVITSKNPYPPFGKFATCFRICYLSKKRIVAVCRHFPALSDALRPSNYDPFVWK